MTRQSWTREAVIGAIRHRQRAGLSLDNVWRTDTHLYSAATRHLGCWSKALAAAGLLTNRHRQWSRQNVIAAIQARHRQGASLRFTRMDDRGLRDAATSHFGGWRKAVRAAGLESELRQEWTKSIAVQALRSWHRQGREMNSVSREHRRLYWAARRLFGSWANALSAAGLESRPRRKWSPERVLAELRRLDSIPGMNIWVHDNALVTVANKYFGSLRQARLAAGLEPTQRACWQRQVVETIQDQYVRGVLVQHNADPGSPVQAAARKQFGSWEKALAAAGIKAAVPMPQNLLGKSRNTA